jgi:hypothetical protein
MLLMALALSACATQRPVEEPPPPPPTLPKTPFAVSTRRMLQDYQLPAIQYYLSDQLTLTRSQERNIFRIDSKGALLQTSGLDVSEINIAKETPGELMTIGAFNLEGVDTEYLGICFDENPDNVLYFVPQADRNQYELLFYYNEERQVVLYNEMEYEVSYRGTVPVLLIAGDLKSNDVIDRKDLSGRLVN